MSETRAPDLPGDLYGSIVAVVVAAAEGDDRNRPALILELAEGIAAAIAAARAEGAALGAANMRDACEARLLEMTDGCTDIEFKSPIEHAAGELRNVPLPTDTDAILRAERVKGAEAAIAAFKLPAVWEADIGLPPIDVVADRVRLLVTP